MAHFTTFSLVCVSPGENAAGVDAEVFPNAFEPPHDVSHLDRPPVPIRQLDLPGACPIGSHGPDLKPVGDQES